MGKKRVGREKVERKCMGRKVEKVERKGERDGRE